MNRVRIAAHTNDGGVVTAKKSDVPSVDFFVSYTHSDEDWARWVSWELLQANFSVLLQAWHFRPGMDFVHEMHTAIMRARRTIVILSDEYLSRSAFGEAEWRSAFAEDPSGELRRLIPIRVRNCKPSGLLRTRIYIDLVNLTKDEARNKLLVGLHPDGDHLEVSPPFPNDLSPRSTPTGFGTDGKGGRN
jgi:hypothetical protein